MPAPQPDTAASDLHALACGLVDAAPDGRWTVFELAQELRRRHPGLASRDARLAVWDCLNGGVIRLQVEAREGGGLRRRRLVPGHGLIEKARACERFRLRAAQERAAA
jgi:hypothetical protein